MSRLLWAGLSLGLGGLAMMATTKKKSPGADASAPRLTWSPMPVRLDSRGGAKLTRTQVRRWARRMGISEHHLVLMIALHSERGGDRSHKVEHEAIARTAVNRTGYPRAFAGDLWGVLVGRASTTGKQGRAADGSGFRQYATTRPPTNADTARYLYAVAARAIARGPVVGDGPDAITHFHHAKGSRAAEVNARWSRKGYTPQNVGDVAGTFLSPTAAKAASLS